MLFVLASMLEHAPSLPRGTIEHARPKKLFSKKSESRRCDNHFATSCKCVLKRSESAGICKRRCACLSICLSVCAFVCVDCGVILFPRGRDCTRLHQRLGRTSSEQHGEWEWEWIGKNNEKKKTRKFRRFFRSVAMATVANPCTVH